VDRTGFEPAFNSLLTTYSYHGGEWPVLNLGYRPEFHSAVPTGFEPAFSSVTGKRDKPLLYGTNIVVKARTISVSKTIPANIKMTCPNGSLSLISTQRGSNPRTKIGSLICYQLHHGCESFTPGKGSKGNLRVRLYARRRCHIG
jgi:hypothetical protein